MNDATSIDKLTPDIIEAVFDNHLYGFLQNEEEPPDEHKREILRAYTLLKHSERIQETFIQGIVEFALSEPQRLAQNIELVCAQMFLVGWHSRGAVEEKRGVGSHRW